TNSPTIAPTTDKHMAILNPANICGSAVGPRTLSMIFKVLAPIERTRSIISLSTLLSPTTVDTTMGKKAIRNTIAIFGRMPKPSQTDQDRSDRDLRNRLRHHQEWHCDPLDAAAQHHSERERHADEYGCREATQHGLHRVGCIPGEHIPVTRDTPDHILRRG